MTLKKTAALLMALGMLSGCESWNIPDEDEVFVVKDEAVSSPQWSVDGVKDLPDGFAYCRKITKDMLENAKAFLVVNDPEEEDYFVDIDVETVLLEGNETPVIIYTLILSDYNGEVLQEWKETIRQVKNDDRTWW